MQHVVLIHSVPVHLLSDNGTNFTSKLAKYLWSTLGTHKHTTTPYHPQSNGRLERSHRALKSTISKLCEQYGVEWDTALSAATFTHNTRINRTTGYTPFYLVYHRQPIRPFELATLRNEDKQSPPEPKGYEYVQAIRERVRGVRQALEKQWEEEREEETDKQQVRATKRTQQWQVNPGDSVWCRNHLRHSLDPRWLGPYVVESVAPDGLVLQVKRTHGHKIRTVHRMHILPDPLLQWKRRHTLASKSYIKQSTHIQQDLVDTDTPTQNQTRETHQ
jgi:hypothetical protein